MSQLLPPTPPEPSQPAGGEGWAVRQSPRPFTQWEAERLLPIGEPILASPGLAQTEAPPPPPPPPARIRSSRRPFVIGAVMFAVAAVAVVVIGRQTAPSPNTTLATGAAAPDAQVIDPAAPTSVTAPTSAPPTSTPDPRVVAQAGHEYLAAALTVNAATGKLEAALQAAAGQTCSCPAGQFDATPALVQVPGVDKALQNFGAALQQIRVELPSLHSDIDRVFNDNQAELVGFAAAYRGGQNGDPVAITGGFAAVHAAIVRGAPDFVKIREDLGLPPASG